MTAHSYLRWPSNRPDKGSWHIVERVDAEASYLRCGRVVTTDHARGSDHLPTGEKSCETCVSWTLRDEDER